MLGPLLTQIFSSANFNRLMFVLAVEGGAYLFSTDWKGWTIFNAVIYGIIGYVLVTVLCYLWDKRPRKDEYKALKEEADIDWARNVRSFWGSLPPDKRRAIIQVYNKLETDPEYINKKFTSDPIKVNMIQQLSNWDYNVRRKNFYTGDYCEEPCIRFESKNGVYSVIFDPVIFKEIKQTSNSNNNIIR